MAPRGLVQWPRGPPKWASGTVSPLVFDSRLHIREKMLALGGEELSRNTPPPPPRSSFWGQIDPGFVLRVLVITFVPT